MRQPPRLARRTTSLYEPPSAHNVLGKYKLTLQHGLELIMRV